MASIFTLPDITRNAQAVEQMMAGTKIAAKNSIQARVYLLLDAFQIVRPWLGMVLEGIRKGNMAAPVVPIVPAQAIAPSHQPRIGLRAPSASAPSTMPTTPSAGSSQSRGMAWKLF